MLIPTISDTFVLFLGYRLQQKTNYLEGMYELVGLLIYNIFSSEIPRLYIFSLQVVMFTVNCCYLKSVKIISYCECLSVERNVFQNQRKCIYKKFNYFNVKYIIISVLKLDLKKYHRTR